MRSIICISFDMFAIDFDSDMERVLSRRAG